jgi:predicted PurR-regulated permease PerM
MAQLENQVFVAPVPEPDVDGVEQEPVGAPSPRAQEVRADATTPRFRLPSVVLATLGILSVLVLAYLAYQLLPVLLLIFVSILFATAIEPIVNWLRRGPFNRSAGILLVYTTLFLLIGAIGFVTLPVVFSQVGELSTSLPGVVKQVDKNVKLMPNGFIRQQADTFVSAAGSVIDQISHPPTPSSAEEKVATAAQATISLAEVFFSVISFFVVAYYWLTERTLIKRSIMSWLPPQRANRVRGVWDDIEVKVGGWVRGQLTLMAIVGAISAVGYFAIGVKYWPVLALFIGLAEAIPLVGPWIGTAPAVLVALTQPGNDGLPSLLGAGDMASVTRALLVVIFAVLLQTVEGNLLVPRVMKNSVGISPLTVIISLLIGVALAGLVGALLAVPIAGSIQVIVQDIKAAHESDYRFEESTEAAKATRQEAGELVVATRAPKPKASDTDVRGRGSVASAASESILGKGDSLSARNRSARNR